MKKERSKKEKEQPKLDCTFFLDRTHGKVLSASMRRVGFKVRSIYQVYPKKKHENTKDPTWIAKCAMENWIAISGDKRLETNIENRKAVIDAKCKIFILEDSNSLPEEWAAAVIAGRLKIESIIRNESGPFFMNIAKNARNHVSDFRVPNLTPIGRPASTPPAQAAKEPVAS